MGKYFLTFFFSPDLIILMVFRRMRNFYHLSSSAKQQPVWPKLDIFHLWMFPPPKTDVKNLKGSHANGYGFPLYT